MDECLIDLNEKRTQSGLMSPDLVEAHNFPVVKKSASCKFSAYTYGSEV